MVTTQSADSVLKSYYLGVVAEQLDKAANPFLARIRKTTSDVWGKDVRKAVRFGVNGGVGAGTEEGDLPKAGDGNYAQFVASLKNLYGTICISDKAIRASASGDGAFVNLLNDEMEDLVRSSSFNFGRMLFGNGTGLLATIASGEGNVYTVDSVQNFAEGMIVDVYRTGGTELAAGGLTVKAIDRAQKTITLGGSAVETPEGYQIYLQNSKGLEITGLEAIFGSGDLYGVAREGKSWMTPYTETVSTLTESAVQKAIDKVEELSGGKVNFIVCSWGVRRALIEALSKYRQTETLALDGGFTAISFNGIPVVADRFCPAGTMYLLNTDDFALHQLCDWQWLEGEDGKVLKQVAGKPMFTATLVKYAELLCYRPCGQAKISGITES